MRYKFLLLILLGFAATSAGAINQSVERQKRITRSFKVDPGVKINIINKYGDVEIKEWSKDSVKFQIHLVGKAKTEEKLIKMLSLVNFRFTTTKSSISAETSVGTTSTDLISELQNLTNAIFTIGSEAKIDYVVYIPKECELSIKNSFGDIYLSNISQKLNIDLSHGDLRVGNITGSVKIKTRFSKAYIKSIKDGSFNTSFSEIDLKKADNLKIESKSTVYKIDEINNLNIDSRKDEFEIENLKTIRGYSTFSKINVEEFDQILDLKTKLGTINLEAVNSSFSSIFIKSEYTDITLVFEENSSYSLMLKHTDLEFKYPGDIAKLETITIDKEEETKLTKGVFGKTNNPKSKIDIEAIKGELKIFHR